MSEFGAHAAGNDDLSVRLERAADRSERFGLGAVEKAAGVDDDGVCPSVCFREVITFGTQARDNSLAVDQGLGAAERNKGNLWH